MPEVFVNAVTEKVYFKYFMKMLILSSISWNKNNYWKNMKQAELPVEYESCEPRLDHLAIVLETDWAHSLPFWLLVGIGINF